MPGTLLNMALLNLGSSDPNLRTAAYNQLCALTATFDLKIEGQLLETSGKFYKKQTILLISVLFYIIISVSRIIEKPIHDQS